MNPEIVDATVTTDGVVEKVSSKHITGCVSASLSDDGESAGIVFTVAGLDGAPDEKLLLTLPASQVSWFRMIGHHLVIQQAKHGKEGKVLQPSVNPKGEEDIHVSDLTQIPGGPPGPGMVGLSMSPGTPMEACYVMTPLTAAKTAALMNQRVLSKLNAAEKEDLRKFEDLMRTAPPMLSGSMVAGG